MLKKLKKKIKTLPGVGNEHAPPCTWVQQHTIFCSITLLRYWTRQL